MITNLKNAMVGDKQIARIYAESKLVWENVEKYYWNYKMGIDPSERGISIRPSGLSSSQYTGLLTEGGYKISIQNATWNDGSGLVKAEANKEVKEIDFAMEFNEYMPQNNYLFAYYWRLRLHGKTITLTWYPYSGTGLYINPSGGTRTLLTNVNFKAIRIKIKDRQLTVSTGVSLNTMSTTRTVELKETDMTDGNTNNEAVFSISPQTKDGKDTRVIRIISAEFK